MALDTLQKDAWATALGRWAIYAFCAQALAYPEPERLDALDTLAPHLEALEVGDDDTTAALRRALDAWSERPGLDELRDAHVGLFTFIDSQECPPYETAYSTADVFQQTATMADVAGFYRAHGLEPGGQQRERPDHITTELEFLAFMARKEAYAYEEFGPEEVEECRRVQEMFLSDHIGCWGVAFGARADATADHPFHAAVGALVRAWLTADMADRSVTPVVVLDQPLPFDEPDDGSCGDICGGCAESPNHERGA